MLLLQRGRARLSPNGKFPGRDVRAPLPRPGVDRILRRPKALKFEETHLQGAWLIEPDRFEDERGYFCRTMCRREFSERGIECDFPQSNVSFNLRAGTLRGLHLQLPPHEEGKLVRCSRGKVFDVMVDLRLDSQTFGRSFSAELSAANGRQLFVPKGFAHGFLTLEPETEVTYLMSEFFAPGASAGYRYDDPAFAVAWPRSVDVIAQKDLELPQFSRALHTQLTDDGQSQQSV